MNSANIFDYIKDKTPLAEYEKLPKNKEDVIPPKNLLIKARPTKKGDDL